MAGRSNRQILSRRGKAGLCYRLAVGLFSIVSFPWRPYRLFCVNYAANSFVVSRNWAGSQRTGAQTAPGTVTVVANSSTPTAGTEIQAKNAFFIKLPNAMREDEIDQKIHSMTQSWGEGIMQRSLRAWGAGHMQEVINRNLGNGSVLDGNKVMAIDGFYNEMELASLFGEQQEGWDSETNDWWGTTDETLIEQHIYHYNDDLNALRVICKPYATAPIPEGS